jgi:eukaryotic-like serine/threonine-protein kinase
VSNGDQDESEPVTRRSDPNVGGKTLEIQLGETVAGRYFIESMLGSGGMGSVLRALDRQTNLHVAIKVMHRELLLMEDAARRFDLEARATATLKSPHAVRIYDVDSLPSGAPFMVMELLEGIDLGTMIRTRGPLPVDRVIHYLLQATEAIAEAHSYGIIHRDLKPRNLFLTKDSIIKVLDFGLAKSLNPHDGPMSSRNTATNLLVGSPNYMSPEQIWVGREVDERTDIWCLGVTLYQLVTGETPFSAPSLAALMTKITTDEQPRISASRIDVPPMIDDVIAQCLRKNPDERYRSITALQTSLLHLRAMLDTHSREVAAVVMSGGATVPADQLPMLPARPSVPMPASFGDDEPTQVSLPEDGPDSEDLRTTRKR